MMLRFHHLLLLSLLPTATASAASPASPTPSLQQESKPWIAPARKARLKNPVEDSAAAIASGRKLFRVNCFACHGEFGKGDGPAGQAMVPNAPNLTIAAIQAQSDGALYWKISKGRAPMPAFAPALDDDQRWQLVLFIRSLATPTPPEVRVLDAYGNLRLALERQDETAFKTAATVLNSSFAAVPVPPLAKSLSAEQIKAQRKSWKEGVAQVRKSLKVLLDPKSTGSDSPAHFLALSQSLVVWLDLLPNTLPHAVVLWICPGEGKHEEVWLQWASERPHNPYSEKRRDCADAVKRWGPPTKEDWMSEETDSTL